MSYEFYKILHVTGAIAVFMGLGAMLLNAMSGAPPKFAQRKWVMIFHGVGMLCLFVAGFGLMARIGLAQVEWPLWLKGKLAFWFLVGAVSAPILRLGKYSKIMWIVTLLLAAGAVSLAVLKPS